MIVDVRVLRRRASRGAALLALPLALVACGGDGDAGDAPPLAGTPAPSPTPTPTPTPTPAPEPSTQRDIAPTAANAEATLVSFVNVAINPDPRAPARNRLFVFLPGTDGAPAGYERIVQRGALRGYHAIGLAYPNDLAVNQACPGVADEECSSKFREEILTGRDLSNLVAVDAPNSIIQRLTDLLAYLARTYPREGWEQYLANGAVDWSKVSVGGHSQGAGHAAYLAKLFVLDRVAMFSGLADRNPAGTAPAAWLARPNRTPADRQYAFGHLRDPVVPFDVQRASWRALGLDAFGAVVSVDQNAPPYGNSHQLSTDAEPRNPDAPRPRVYHSVPITNGAVPVDAQGAAVFVPVWAYMALP